jgi:hypothetical protein
MSSSFLYQDDEVFDFAVKIFAQPYHEVCVNPLKFIPAVAVEIPPWKVQILANSIFTDGTFC